ncbi:hypothetical protein YC2023_063320 [Brassica napus]
MHESMYGENGSFINTWHHTKVSSLCRLYGSSASQLTFRVDLVPNKSATPFELS